MPSDEYDILEWQVTDDTAGEDGIFKLLTWDSPAITRIFDLPEIQGDPLQQEFQRPMKRYVDRLYWLKDRSILNIEHQSSLPDRDALARRMIDYRNMVREKFRQPVIIRQVVVFTGLEPKNRNLIRDLDYVDLDENGNGVRFYAVVKDFLSVPLQVFRESGKIDDLILGILASGRKDPNYIEEVRRRIGSLQGEESRSAKEKFVAVCAITGNNQPIGRGQELDMWIDDVKDTPLIQRIVEVAGKDRINEEGRRVLARAVIYHAVKRHLALPDTAEETEVLLTAYASQEALFRMVEDLPAMEDFADFVKEHGVELPAHTA